MSETRKFAVFDIDGTVIRWQLYHAVVNQLAKQGDISTAADLKIREARMTWKNRASLDSFHDYEMTLVKSYWQALENITPAAHDQAIQKVFDLYKDQVFTFTRDLIKELKNEQYFLLAISGSHQEIIDKLADYYGFDAAIGQIHEIKNGRYTGAHSTPMLAKDLELAKLIKKFHLTLSKSIGVGDSAGDIKMLEMVETPIAFNPEINLYNHARKHRWQIILERKNVIYKLEPTPAGYHLALVR